VERGATLAQSAQHSICIFFSHPSLLSYEEGLQLAQNPLRRGISYRTIYEHSIWQEADSREFVRQCQDWGQQVRFVPEVPFKMQLFDSRVTLLSLQDPLVGTPSFTALSITHPGLANMLQIAFEHLWQQGTLTPQVTPPES
jgi:hypothetical protein